ncbi:MAG: carboxypeptidase regulatory-like domain-containing protein [Thainema sp.]
MASAFWASGLPTALLLTFGWQAASQAHGVVIDYTPVSAVQLTATYDNGDPMAEAQVNVYAPENPAEAWLTGQTDERGQFIFTPDAAQAGNWEVQVRQAGHGDIVNIPVNTEADGSVQVTDAIAKRTSNGYSTPQIVLMGAAGIWGFVGTALFFSREK